MVKLRKKKQKDVKLSEKILSPIKDAAKGFHFHEDINKPLHQIAVSLEDFAEKLKTISLSSIEFHMKRGDFSKWVEDTIRDSKLAHAINRIKTGGEDLRKELISAVEKRIEELRKAL